MTDQKKYSKGLEYRSNGDATCYVHGLGRCKDAHLVIPPVSPTGDHVTAIGSYAFPWEEHLKSVTIPKGVTEIRRSAFDGCTRLQTVRLPEGLTRIEGEAFSGCESLARIDLPESIAFVGDEAFEGCNDLQYTRSEDVEYLGNSKSPYLALIRAADRSIGSCAVHPDTRVIAGSAFSDCDRLKRVELPCGLVSIGNLAFSGCSALRQIDLPETLTEIGHHAFADCVGLENVTIPREVTMLGESAFAGCTELKSVAVAKGNAVYHSAGNCIVKTKSKALAIGFPCSEIPDDGSVTSIGAWAFYGCTGLKKLVIPKGVCKIEEHAFFECSDLAEIEFPASVTELPGNALAGCVSLAKVKIARENKVYRTAGNCIIEKKSGRLIKGLYTSVIPADGSVTSIGAHAFEGSRIIRLAIPEGVTGIEAEAFSCCSDLESVTLPSTLTSLGKKAFYFCMALKNIRLPDGLDLLKPEVFSCCSHLESVTLPANLTAICEKAFQGCGALTEIDLPRGLDGIDEFAFGGCTGLTSISIPAGLTRLRFSTFGNCRDLKTVTLPTSIKMIETGAFDSCYALEAILYAGTKAQWRAVSLPRLLFNIYSQVAREHAFVIRCSDGEIKQKRK